MGFAPSRADADLWIQDKGDHYEYVATFVNNLKVFLRDCETIIKEIQKDYILKEIGTPEYYLGGNVQELEGKQDQCIKTGLSAET